MTNWLVAKLDLFDPNAAKEPFATYAPNRTGNWKVHASRAVALNAMGANQYALLYTREGDKWVLVARKCQEDHHATCTVCGGSTMGLKRIPSWARTGSGFVNNPVDLGKFAWQRGKGRRITTPLTLLYLCETCYAIYR